MVQENVARDELELNSDLGAIFFEVSMSFEDTASSDANSVEKLLKPLVDMDGFVLVKRLDGVVAGLDSRNNLVALPEFVAHFGVLSVFALEEKPLRKCCSVRGSNGGAYHIGPVRPNSVGEVFGLRTASDDGVGDLGALLSELRRHSVVQVHGFGLVFGHGSSRERVLAGGPESGERAGVR